MNVRIGSECKDKWTMDQIEKEIITQPNIERIFACGPSKMCEDFDKAFFLLASKHKLSRHMFETM